MHNSNSIDEDAIDAGITRAYGILPDQGPIGVFIHHNTLHSYQHLPFHRAIQEGAARLGAHAYMALERFHAAWKTGRIEEIDLDEALDDLPSADETLQLPLGLSRRQLRRALLVEHIDDQDAAGLLWRIRNGPSPVAGDMPLWEAALERVARGPLPTTQIASPPLRHRDALIACGARDPDIAVTHELTSLCSSFLDQGQAGIALPNRSEGFLMAVSLLFASGASVPRLCRGAEDDFRRIAIERTPAKIVIAAALDALGVPEDERKEYVIATALALPGWAGMFSRLERNPAENRAHCPISLAEFIAVRMVFDRHAAERSACEALLPTSWKLLPKQIPLPEPIATASSAFLLWNLARVAGARPQQVCEMNDESLATLWHETSIFHSGARGQVWLEAYESRYRRAILGAVANRRRMDLPTLVQRARAQFIFCIDEREESIRRALEEQDSAFVTFGAAGFFGMAIDYVGLYDHEPAAHCPVVVVPAHEVHEQPVLTQLSWHERRAVLRDQWHGIERAAASWSRTLTGGAGLSLLLGPIAGIAAVLRVLAPRTSLDIRDRIETHLAPRPDTRLGGIREEPSAPLSRAGKPMGFSLQEATDRVAGMLRSIGIVGNFSKIILVLGHGSTSLNNPHESAHDCGACGGRRGGANARLFADLANRNDVRDSLRAIGIDIPSDTWFVGALHDTANDAVQCFDLEELPSASAAPFADAWRALEIARRHSALERVRRFESAPLGLSPDDALRHVEERAAHLAQPRPEYGHCTNACAFVGRRSITRGLHLDRRAFLVSYDPTTDPTNTILERILAAVGPVGAGISLEYYFSSVDLDRFGCGTKLPHNVTGLLGVSNGHRGDLRTGLPLQMVEIHEPMRLLLVVEATPAALLEIAGRQAEVRELVVNEWVQLVSLDPTTGHMQRFHNGAFHDCRIDNTPLQSVNRSVEWHGLSREYVSPALVLDGLDLRPLAKATA